MLNVESVELLEEKGGTRPLWIWKSVFHRNNTNMVPAFHSDVNKDISKHSPAPNVLHRCSQQSEVIWRLPVGPNNCQDFAGPWRSTLEQARRVKPCWTMQDKSRTSRTLHLTTCSHPAREGPDTLTPMTQLSNPPSLGTAAPHSPYCGFSCSLLSSQQQQQQLHSQHSTQNYWRQILFLANSEAGGRKDTAYLRTGRSPEAPVWLMWPEWQEQLP